MCHISLVIDHMMRNTSYVLHYFEKSCIVKCVVEVQKLILLPEKKVMMINNQDDDSMHPRVGHIYRQ